MDAFYNSIKQWLEKFPIINNNLEYIGVLLLAYVSYFITRKIFFRIVHRLTKRTETILDDLIFNERFIKYISALTPLYVIYSFAYLGESFQPLIEHSSNALIILFIILAVGNLVTSLTEFYSLNPKFVNQPIKGYSQVVRIILYIFGGLFIIGVFTGEKPLVILTGLGALSAVILLIFKDTILSFVASIQISSYELIKKGDWIEIPSLGADGLVIDIALHTVKVQNWDKTYVLIPTYKIVENSVKNWRGMEQSKSRRIKRFINIDINTIKFIDSEFKKSLKNSSITPELKKLLFEKLNSGNQTATNLGLLLQYIVAFVQYRDDIRKDLICVARQLQPTAEGLPIELYAFCSKINFSEFEQTQSEIFEHIFAILPVFGLSIFQSPGGSDLYYAIKRDKN